MSYAGLTRVSIYFARDFNEGMDCRVKPGNDENKYTQSFRDGPKDQTSDVQLHIGESRRDEARL
jgi:hypothetical protein